MSKWVRSLGWFAVWASVLCLLAGLWQLTLCLLGRLAARKSRGVR